MPQYNAIIRKFKGKPVAFFAVAAGDTINEASQYVAQTKMAMPAFADSLSVMETRYGTKISLNNIHQYRVIDPEGRIVAQRFDEASIEQALKDAKWRFKEQGYDKKLDKAVELFEWNQYEAGMKALKPFLKKGGSGPTAESAQKLYDEIKAEGEQWLTEAEGLKESDPVTAYDLYSRVSSVFGASDEMGKKADEALKTLKKDKAVKDELAARKMFAQVAGAMAKAKPAQRGAVAQFCKNIVKKYPETPTAKRAESLVDEITSIN